MCFRSFGLIGGTTSGLGAETKVVRRMFNVVRRNDGVLDIAFENDTVAEEAIVNALMLVMIMK